MHRAAFCCRKTSSAAIAHAQSVRLLSMLHRLLVIVPFVAAVGCEVGVDVKTYDNSESRQYSTGFKSTDDEYMQALMDELDNRGIEYSVNSDGAINYRIERQVVDQIHEQVRYRLHGAIGFKIESEGSLEDFKKYLDMQDIEYYEETRPDGMWVMYYPPDQESNGNQMPKTIAEFLEFRSKDKSACKPSELAAVMEQPNPSQLSCSAEKSVKIDAT